MGPHDCRITTRYDEQFFLIEAWRFGSGPLAYEAGGPCLALYVRVSWPYRQPGAAAATAASDRERVTFNLALRR